MLIILYSWLQDTYDVWISGFESYVNVDGVGNSIIEFADDTIDELN